ncbi:hypothetical protein TNCV_616811 [Trichonephila clavipes]|nr:hypothetical protein TNCV_616811 [Trichonephila clavipes]
MSKREIWRQYIPDEAESVIEKGRRERKEKKRIERRRKKKGRRGKRRRREKREETEEERVGRERSPPCMEKRAESGDWSGKTMNAGGVENRLD